MKVDLESGSALLQAGSGSGFDPVQIPAAIEAAGFGPGEIALRARGTATGREGLLALNLPGSPALLVLAGGARIEALAEAGLPEGTALDVQGRLHPSHADQPPGITVEEWSVGETEKPSD